jgi:hypothetical protein
MPGLDPGIHRKKLFIAKRMDCRVISAFTRVFNALCPAMTAEETELSPFLSPLWGGVRGGGRCVRQRRCITVSPPSPTLPQPKSDLSDFGQLKMPNSGKPEFGRGREQTEHAALTSNPDASPAGLTTQVGFIRLAHLKRPKSGKPDFGWSIVLRKTFFAKRMDCRVKPGNDGGSRRVVAV